MVSHSFLRTGHQNRKHNPKTRWVPVNLNIFLGYFQPTIMCVFCFRFFSISLGMSHIYWRIPYIFMSVTSRRFLYTFNIKKSMYSVHVMSSSLGAAHFEQFRGCFFCVIFLRLSEKVISCWKGLRNCNATNERFSFWRCHLEILQQKFLFVADSPCRQWWEHSAADPVTIHQPGAWRRPGISPGSIKCQNAEKKVRQASAFLP